MYRKRNSVELAIMIVVLLFIPLLVHDQYYVPLVMNDEIGYLVNAAYMVGYDWSKIMQDIPYYSYGYSLIICPLIRCFHLSNRAYEFVILLNGIFMAITFVCVVKIARIIFPTYTKNRNLVCLAATISCAQIVYSQYALAESIVTMCATISILFMIKILYEDKIVNYVWIAFFSIFTYCCHQRALVIVIATIIIVFFKVISNRDKKGVAIFVCSMCLFCVIHIMLKKWIKESIWINQGVTEINDYSGVFDKASLLLSLGGIKLFMESMIGKIYAVCLSYCYVPLILVFSVIKRLKSCWKKTEKVETMWIAAMLLLMIMMMGIGVCAIFHIVPYRLDTIVYTRYIDYLLPIVMLMGIYAIKDIQLNDITIISIIMIFLGAANQQIMDNAEVKSFIIMQTPIIGFMRLKNINYLLAINLISLFYVIWIYVKSKKNICEKIKKLFVLEYIVLGIFMGKIVADDFANNWVMDYEVRKSIYHMGQIINEECAENETIYLLQGENYLGKYYGGALQTQIPNYECEYVAKKELTENMKYIVMRNDKTIEGFQPKYELMYQDEEFKMLRQNSSLQ